MTEYEISYNLKTPQRVKFTVDEGEILYEKFLTRLEKAGVTIPQVINQLAFTVKNLTTGERYKLNQTGTDLEKAN